jgi:CheY-like chemotaxis protein
MMDDHERRLRCLVVGNEEIIAEGLSEILELMGHSVECVRSGQEAISRFSGDRFDLVLIDGHERLEVARALKDAAPSTWVILATGVSQERLRNPEFDRSLRASGVDLILHKPFSFEDLKRALADFARRNRVAPPEPPVETR